jgi:phosphoglycerate dehydrogenase-like enzyme
MQPSAILINTSRGTSRGEVVDEAALYRGLRDRRIQAAGLNAWTEEPIPPDNPILALDNVPVTPHMATGNRDAMIRKSEAVYAHFGACCAAKPRSIPCTHTSKSWQPHRRESAEHGSARRDGGPRG